MVKDDVQTAFPASADTPGQRQSRTAYGRLRARLEHYPWAEDYLELRQQGWTWRKAVYIAWASLPADKRQPATQRELATQVLGLKSAHTISKWKRKQPEIADAIAELQAGVLLKYRAAVFDALGEVAARHDHKAHPDRKLFLEMAGDYKRNSSLEVTDGAPKIILDELDDE